MIERGGGTAGWIGEWGEEERRRQSWKDGEWVVGERRGQGRMDWRVG